MKRGEIYFADLGGGDLNRNSEQDGYRPVLIIQNDIGNHYSPTTIVVCLTSKVLKAKLPTHVRLSADIYALHTDSLVLCEQIKTIDKGRLGRKLTQLTPADQARVDYALAESLALSLA